MSKTNLTDAAEAAASVASKNVEVIGADQHVPEQSAKQLPQTVHPSAMINALLAQPDLTAEKMELVEKAFALQERYEAGQAKQAYFAAVAGFQAEVDPVIGYDKTVTYGQGQSRTEFDFTSLAKINKTVRPILAKHGLTLTYRTGSTEAGNPVVTAILTHELGHGEDTTLSAPVDASGGKNAIQAVRSAWSYLRRLTAESILGIATGYDDDDDGANAGDRQTREEAQPEQKPAMPGELYKKNRREYYKRIQSGQGTPAQLIAKLQTKYTLTTAQLADINDMIKPGGTDESNNA